MALLPPTSFIAAVASSKEQFDKISEIVERYFGQEKADSFSQACKEHDFTTANRILEDTIKELTGHSPVSIALRAFADKFPQLSPELGNKVSSALSEPDKVKAIESFRLKILSIIGVTDNE